MSAHRLITYIYRSIKLEYRAEQYDDQTDTSDRTRGQLQTGEWLGLGEVLRALSEPIGADLGTELGQSLPPRWRPLAGVVGPIETRMVASWQDFAAKVRSGPRFGFGGATVTSDPHHVDDVLHFFGTSVERMDGNIIKILDPGQELFRARVSRNGPLATADELGSPPLNKAGPQRMSSAGVSCFYAAETKPTAVAEMRTGEPISVGRWRTRTPIRFLELSQPWEMPSVFDPVGRSTRASVRFVRDFEKEISKPKDDNIGDANSYLPTQIFAEYLRYSLPTQYGQGVDAIRYRSDARLGGINWCVFGQPDRGSDPTIDFVGPASGPQS